MGDQIVTKTSGVLGDGRRQMTMVIRDVREVQSLDEIAGVRRRALDAAIPGFTRMVGRGSDSHPTHPVFVVAVYTEEAKG